MISAREPAICRFSLRAARPRAAGSPARLLHRGDPAAFRVLAVGDRFLDRLAVRYAAGQIGKLDQLAAALVPGQGPDREAIIRFITITHQGARRPTHQFGQGARLRYLPELYGNQAHQDDWQPTLTIRDTSVAPFPYLPPWYNP
jgi:hypothetical protein